MSKAVITFVFLVVSAASLSNQDILQQALNGVFSQNWLPNPTAAIDCIDETTSKQIVDFIDASLEKLAKGSISDILPVLKRISTYTDELPPQVTDCLYEDDELWTLGPKYGISKSTDVGQLEKVFMSYFYLHYLALHKYFGILNTEWKATKYFQSGLDAATYAHEIWKPTALAENEII